MGKPASIRRVELRKAIMEAIDESKLPPYVVTEVLKGILNVSVRNEEYQYRADLAAWTEEQQKEAKSHEKEADVKAVEDLG